LYLRKKNRSDIVKGGRISMSTKSATSLSGILKNNEMSFRDKAQIIKQKVQRFLFGFNDRAGFLLKFVIYLLLLCIGFVYLYPILYMFVTSIQSLSDLLDMSINWIPSSLYLDNYHQAYSVLNVRPALLGRIHITLF